jgi:hypothetical protein
MRRRYDIGSSSLCGWVGFLAALAIYVATLLPGVAFWDTGEMQTVPFLLGIAHPTGFPAFVLGGWLFAHAFPFGEPAWRLSLFAALAAAGASGALAAFVCEIAGNAPVGVAAAGVFALGDVAWTRGVRADVHDLALACVAFALLAALRAGRDRSARAAGFAALWIGFGIATHPVALLAVPAAIVIGWPALERGRGLVACATLALAPLALYAYVPLRSADVEAHDRDPAAALGIRGGAIWDADAPATPAAFARYVAGTAFDPAGAFASARTPRGFGRIRTFATAVARREYSPLVLALALTGFIFLGIVRRRVALGFAILVALEIAFAANFAAESDRERYLLGALWAAAACAGIGAWWLATSLAGPARPRLGAALAMGLLALGLWPNVLGAAHDLAQRRGASDARAFVATVERDAVPGSLVVASWTFATPLAYQIYVARTLRLRLICGWPLAYTGRFAAWRRAFGHVYVVAPPWYAIDVPTRAIASSARYRLSEVRS